MKLSDLKETPSARVTCKAANEGGSDESSANLIVGPGLVAPNFAKPLNDIAVNAGDSFTGSVTIVGDPTPTVEWFLNGKKLADGVDGVVMKNDENGNYEVTIPKANNEHKGELVCKASNPAGKAESNCKVGWLGSATLFLSKHIFEIPNFIHCRSLSLRHWKPLNSWVISKISR